MIDQAVLLLGGRGTRLWPLTESRPKGLLPVAGLPFFEYQVRLLAELDVSEIFLAVGKPWERSWQSYLAERPDLSHVRLAVEEHPLDTAGPVRAILDQLSGPFLTLNGDVLFDADLREVFGPRPEGATLVLSRVDDPSAFGVVVTDSSGAVTEFVEKPTRERAPADTISAGIYLLTPDAISRFPQGPLSFERSVFPLLAQKGELSAVVAEGSWMDIGTPELYIDAHAYVAAGRCHVYLPELPTGPGEIVGRIDGPVWAGSGALVEEGAIISDSVVLPGGVVRTGATVRGSVIGWGAEVKEGAEVVNGSIVGEEAVVGKRCEIRGLRIAAGAVLSERSVTVRPPS